MGDRLSPIEQVAGGALVLWACWGWGLLFDRRRHAWAVEGVRVVVTVGVLAALA